MLKRISLILLLLTLLATSVLAYYWGYSKGKRNTETTFIQNFELVKSIAELSSLEVQGKSELKETNLSDGSTVWGQLSDYFFERSLALEIPYTAKYGINANDSNFSVKRDNEEILINVPAPELLSLELHLDRINSHTEKGFLQFQNDNTYKEIQKKLYEKTRKDLEGKMIYINEASAKVDSVFFKIYKPFGKTIKITHSQKIVKPS